MQRSIRLAKGKSISYLKLPFDFFENNFREMSAPTIKMFMYILYLCTLGDVEIDNEILKNKLNITELQIEKAYKELADEGFLRINEETGEEELVDPEEYYKNFKKESYLEQKSKNKMDLPKFGEQFSKQLEFIELNYGKPLTNSDLFEIYDLIENQKVPFEVVLCAVDYSLQKNKKNINYIAKVALNWKELGLNSYESCERYISEENINEDSVFKQIKGHIKLQRDLLEVEKQYINDWYFKQGKSIDEIKKAFDKAVINTGKISFPYVNSVLLKEKPDYSKNKPFKKNDIGNFSQRDYDSANVLEILRKKQNG